MLFCLACRVWYARSDKFFCIDIPERVVPCNPRNPSRSATDDVDVGWMCEGVAHSISTAVGQLSETEKHCQDCLMSTIQSFNGCDL